MDASKQELLDILREISSLQVRGHALIERLQFSEAGRILAAKIRSAIQKAEDKQ